MVKRVGKYEIGKTLGEGTFGKVKYAVNTETGEKVAIKILDKEKIQQQNMGNQIKKEISIMKMVKHDNVVKLYEVLASRSKIFIVLELITGGELFDKIVADGRFDEPTARLYFRQLMKGIKYCHSQGVCHRDLKPENLLLDASGGLKMSDFGLSALYTGSPDDESRATLLHTTCGTPNYVAPEVLADKGYDGRAADIWSAGVILYVLLAGFLPFDEPHMTALFRKIQKAEFQYPAWFTPPVKALIGKLLLPDPKVRASIADIEADPWFLGPDNYHDDNLAFQDPEAAIQAAAGNMHYVSGSGAAATPATPGRVLTHVPSAKNIDEAVEDVEEMAVTANPSEDSSKGPRLLNAFDVVNMFGGLELARIMETPVTSREAGEKRVSSSPQFMSAAPADTLLSRISAGMTALGVTAVADNVMWKVKGRVVAGKGEISLSALLYRVSEQPPLHLVEITRGRGDPLEFASLHTKLRAALADLAVPARRK